MVLENRFLGDGYLKLLGIFPSPSPPLFLSGAGGLVYLFLLFFFFLFLDEGRGKVVFSWFFSTGEKTLLFWVEKIGGIGVGGKGMRKFRLKGEGKERVKFSSR